MVEHERDKMEKQLASMFSSHVEGDDTREMGVDTSRHPLQPLEQLSTFAYRFSLMLGTHKLLHLDRTYVQSN